MTKCGGIRQSPWGKSPGCTEDAEGTRTPVNRSLTVLSEIYGWGIILVKEHLIQMILFQRFKLPCYNNLNLLPWHWVC